MKQPSPPSVTPLGRPPPRPFLKKGTGTALVGRRPSSGSVLPPRAGGAAEPLLPKRPSSSSTSPAKKPGSPDKPPSIITVDASTCTRDVRPASPWPARSFALLLSALAIAFTALLGAFAEYAPASGSSGGVGRFLTLSLTSVVGVGFVLASARHYSLGVVALNLLSAAVVVVEAVLLRGALDASARPPAASPSKPIELDIELLSQGVLAATSSTVSLGALVGSASPTQLLLLLVFGAPAHVLARALGFERLCAPLGAVDAGGSMGVHALGAYYGLSSAWVLQRSRRALGAEHSKRAAPPTTELVSLLGAALLWGVMPAFNSAAAGAELRFCAVVNTVLAIAGATLAAYAAPVALGGGRRLDLRAMPRATLAGAVAIGSAAALEVSPATAFAVGAGGGALAAAGLLVVGPRLERHCGLRDVCGVHSLHGMPGLFGGLAAAGHLCATGERAAALAQLCALALALGVAVVAGLSAGLLVSCVDRSDDSALAARAFHDAAFYFGDTDETHPSPLRPHAEDPDDIALESASHITCSQCSAAGSSPQRGGPESPGVCEEQSPGVGPRTKTCETVSSAATFKSATR